ncbi:MAG: hypothetical protein U9N80_00600, partial [Chloroflexota bacterium]|nr:hypothetical protein [Chloroflexota bacterium]
PKGVAMKSHLIIAISILLYAACDSGSSAPTSDLDATFEIALEQTMAAIPTNTSTMTPTEKPTLTPAPTSTKIPTISPTQAAKDEVKSFSIETLDDGSSHYAYQEAGFSVSLPNNWEHLDLSATDLDQILAYAKETNPQLGDIYSSTYLRSLAAAGIKFMAVDTSVDSLSAGIPTSMNILVSDLPIDISLDDYVEINIQQLRTMLGENLLITQERVPVSITEAEKITYELEMNDVFGKSHIVVFNQFLMLQGKTQYVLTFGTVKEYSDVNKVVFSDIVQSFEITQ